MCIIKLQELLLQFQQQQKTTLAFVKVIQEFQKLSGIYTVSFIIFYFNAYVHKVAYNINEAASFWPIIIIMRKITI